jgi:cytochrome bd-type quinol oxidase subunit 2
MSDRKAMWDKFKVFMGSLMFQLLIGFVAGTIVAGYGMHYYQKYRMEEAVVMLKCFVYNNKVYQITERP